MLNDRSVEFSEGNGNWINLACPFCYKGDGKFGLGWSGTVFSCFACGKLRTWETVAALLNVSLADARGLCLEYSRGSYRGQKGGLSGPQGNVSPLSAVSMPYGTTRMGLAHQDYLSKRGFNPSKLEAEWGLLGTGPLGEFKFRIVIPVQMGGTSVCYQARDITGKAKAKYLSCHDADAVTPLKNCLYGLDKCQGRDWIAIAEGPTKVWRLGAGAVATFGAAVSDNQLRILKQFKHRSIIFDHDEAGVHGADDLAARLAVFGGSTDVLWLGGVTDVADISDADAQLLMTRCGKK